MNQDPPPLPQSPQALALSKVADNVGALADAMRDQGGKTIRAINRAVVVISIAAILSLGLLVLAGLLLVRSSEQSAQIAALTEKIGTLVASVDDARRASVATKEAVTEAQDALDAAPAVDIELRQPSSVTPSASAKPPQAVVVIRPRKPAASASASAVPSIEIPLPLPSSTEPKR